MSDCQWPGWSVENDNTSVTSSSPRNLAFNSCTVVSSARAMLMWPDSFPSSATSMAWYATDSSQSSEMVASESVKTDMSACL